MYKKSKIGMSVTVVALTCQSTAKPAYVPVCRKAGHQEGYGIQNYKKYIKVGHK